MTLGRKSPDHQTHSYFSATCVESKFFDVGDGGGVSP